MQEDVYKSLAERLDSLPNGFPPTDDGVELRLLAQLFSRDEAALAARLRPALETPEAIAARTDGDPQALRQLLKSMARKGLIKAGRAAGGVGYGLLPFVVGIYEMQAGTIDADLAALFEDYYMTAFGQMLSIEPQVHRVIPVGESVRTDIEVRPYENAADIVADARAWGVTDCICRTQKALIGEACDHPVDVCMVISQRPGAFDRSPTVRALTHDQAQATLLRAAEAGLVHSVSNNQRGLWYICNCCTCSCGILRGMADLGIANVVARSAFVNEVDEEACVGCELCVDHCQFDALTMHGVVAVNAMRCVGCGVCVSSCPDGALILVSRSPDEAAPPVTEADWLVERAAARGMATSHVM